MYCIEIYSRRRFNLYFFMAVMLIYLQVYGDFDFFSDAASNSLLYSLVNGEMVRMWKETVVTSFKYQPVYCQAGDFPL
jgi:hypothetical protein